MNYLDDYLFVVLLQRLCNTQLDAFLHICNQIGLPISIDKTVRATTLLTFLGFLIDTINQVVLIPAEKITRAINMITFILDKTLTAKTSKITVLQLQRVCGFLNFIGRAIVSGRAFTRRLYARLENNNLRPHHHVRVTSEMKLDLRMWLQFLNHPTVFCRSFFDYSSKLYATEIEFYMDASKI